MRDCGFGKPSQKFGTSLFQGWKTNKIVNQVDGLPEKKKREKKVRLITKKIELATKSILNKITIY